MSVYLDYNASGLVRPEVQEIMAKALADNGNPSAVHAAGRRARARIETARGQVAELVGADPTAVVFSSGGTESNAQAIVSALTAGCARLIVGATEHPCVAEAAAVSGVPVEVLPVDGNGVVDLVWLAEALARPGRAVVAIHHANNESGVIQPIVEAAALVRAAGGWLHVDAIQAAGKIITDSRALGADTLVVSAHKLGGPQGVGALTFGPRATLVRRQHGGGQERGRRAGTENVAGIAGFGAAALAAMRDREINAAWRDAASERLKAAGAVVIGEAAPRLPNTLCVATADWGAELQVMALDLAGIMVSAGSACSSGKVKASHVLTAMGLTELAGCAIRVSGGWATTQEDWAAFAIAWEQVQFRHAARRRAPAA